MRKRSQAREIALQILYQIDLTRDQPQEALENFWQAQKQQPDAGVKEFAALLVNGVLSHLKEIDEQISRYAKNWQLKRMAVVDRNILRLGSFELLFGTDIPPKVAINEAVELSKRFSGLEAAKFVNGILDGIRAQKT